MVLRDSIRSALALLALGICFTGCQPLRQQSSAPLSGAIRAGEVRRVDLPKPSDQKPSGESVPEHVSSSRLRPATAIILRREPSNKTPSLYEDSIALAAIRAKLKAQGRDGEALLKTLSVKAGTATASASGISDEDLRRLCEVMVQTPGIHTAEIGIR